MGQIYEEIRRLEWKINHIYALDSELWLTPQRIETPGIQTEVTQTQLATVTLDDRDSTMMESEVAGSDFGFWSRARTNDNDWVII